MEESLVPTPNDYKGLLIASGSLSEVNILLVGAIEKGRQKLGRFVGGRGLYILQSPKQTDS
jgi:hypothetical protein